MQLCQLCHLTHAKSLCTASEISFCQYDQDYNYHTIFDWCISSCCNVHTPLLRDMPDLIIIKYKPPFHDSIVVVKLHIVVVKLHIVVVKLHIVVVKLHIVVVKLHIT